MLFFRAIWIRRFTWESVLEQEYWESKWQAGEIAFHQEQVNPDLIRFAESLLSQADSQVLVPLCGKSQDMFWLAKKGHSVLGVEIVEQAAHEFFSENKISATQKDLADFRIYSDEAIQIWVGDFFRLTQSHLKDVKAVYDRAALVALPPDLRKQYAAHLKEVLPKNTKYLLLNFEYELETSKPPFSVSEEEVRSLFADNKLEVLESRRGPMQHPRLKKQGAEEVREKVFLIEF